MHHARKHASTTIGRATLRRLATVLLLLPTVAVLGAQAGPAAASEVCAGEHLDPPADQHQPSFTYTAPAGYLISGWCVKAGTVRGVPRRVTGATGPPSVTIEHSSGKDVSHYSVVLVKVAEKPLTTSVTASGTLARTYPWSIEKKADATTRTVDANGKATFTYTVTARAGAMTESGWAMSGSATVNNPNAYAGITADVAVATDLGGGSSCTVTGGEDVVVPASGQVTLPYTCSFSSAPAASGTVTSTVTWDPEGPDASASASGSTAVSFTVASETNKTVEVVDDKTVPGQRIVLDPALTWAAGLVKTYTYSLAVAGGAAGACATHTNIATIDQPVGTDPSASATVQACTPALPPVVVPPVVVPPTEVPEVLPEQAFGKAVGSVKASCQGTVKAKLANRSGETVTYKLRVGSKVHKITVKSQSQKKFVTKGQALAKVTLKVGSAKLDQLRIPSLCQAPEVLPDTGLRARPPEGGLRSSGGPCGRPTPPPSREASRRRRAPTSPSAPVLRRRSTPRPATSAPASPVWSAHPGGWSTPVDRVEVRSRPLAGRPPLRPSPAEGLAEAQCGLVKGLPISGVGTGSTQGNGARHALQGTRGATRPPGRVALRT